MVRYEYKIHFNGWHDNDELDKYGKLGWKLVSVDNGTMYLMREIQE